MKNACTIHILVFVTLSDKLKAHNLHWKVFPLSVPKYHSKFCVLPMALSAKANVNTSCVSNAVFLSSKQNETQVCCPFKSGIRKSQITLHAHNCNHLLRRNLEVCGSKTHCATHKMAIPYHLVARPALLAVRSLRGEFGKFHMCLHIEVQCTVPPTLTVCSSLTRRKSLQGLIFVVPSIILYSSGISPTRCNNCVFILRNGFTLHVLGDSLTHHQEYICCIWPQVSWLI